MTREESADALELILKGDPSPAQIGAFMIAHRIRRPEPQELAGMIDTYLKLGPILSESKNNPIPICFGMPFDGRNKTAPIYPLTSIVLIDLGQPVVLHGGDRMPVKYGVTTVELFNSIGLCLKGLNMNQVQDGFSQHGLAFIYQPDHFPIAENLITYRHDIGKRPPLASMELLWTAHQGTHLLITGYVHPPTESRHAKALELLGEKNIVAIKGLEGGIDIPLNRTSTGIHIKANQKEKLVLNPRIYNCLESNILWENLDTWRSQSIETLNGESALRKAVMWNAGIYLWLAKITNTIEDGIQKAEHSLASGSAKATLQKLIQWRSKIN